MNRSRSWNAAVFCSVLALACCSTYTGFYWIKKADYPESVDFSNLGAQVGLAIADLGFKRQPPIAPHLVWFLKERGKPESKASGLDGSDARMTVAVDLSELYIAIRDFSNPTETEFNKAVRRRIEERLKSRYSVSGLVFDRQLDMPFPN